MQFSRSSFTRVETGHTHTDMRISESIRAVKAVKQNRVWFYCAWPRQGGQAGHAGEMKAELTPVGHESLSVMKTSVGGTGQPRLLFPGPTSLPALNT